MSRIIAHNRLRNGSLENARLQGCEASDERVAARLAGVEVGGIARAAAVTQKRLFPYHPQETAKVSWQYYFHGDHVTVENWILLLKQ